ncbi:MAG TPA: hypothetical protein VMM38_15635 [Aridibacter sp.]|nr:hypothetical protein [Aridibacter sp.]
MIRRREFLLSAAAGGILSGARPITASPVYAFQTPEPKSIHTWLESPEPNIYAYDVDVRINDFPANADRKWLYYFSLQVNFTGHKGWSHGGIQWAGVREFNESNNLGVNWGGGSDWAGYGGIGVNNIPYRWEKGKWYRYRAWRLKKEADGLWRWLFAMFDYSYGKEQQFGTVRTKSEHIKSAVVFTETGYGVACVTPRTDVEWRNPRYRTPAGIFVPTKGTATYNGTCTGRSNTQQGLVSKDPLQWFHSTGTRRTVAYNDRLWG